jgi:hypothetical protein
VTATTLVGRHQLVGAAPRQDNAPLDERVAAIVRSLLLGAGGVCATAGDLVKWTHALHTGKVLAPATYKSPPSKGRRGTTPR